MLGYCELEGTDDKPLHMVLAEGRDNPDLPALPIIHTTPLNPAHNPVKPTRPDNPIPMQEGQLSRLPDNGNIPELLDLVPHNLYLQLGAALDEDLRPEHVQWV